MEIKKGDHTYIVSEKVSQWSVKTDFPKLGVSYSVPKEICQTFDDVKKYISENDIF